MVHSWYVRVDDRVYALTMRWAFRVERVQPLGPYAIRDLSLTWGTLREQTKLFPIATDWVVNWDKPAIEFHEEDAKALLKDPAYLLRLLP